MTGTLVSLVSLVITGCAAGTSGLTPSDGPDHLRPATADFLRGEWALPDEPTVNARGASFDIDGSYRGYDGCTTQGGRYVIGDDGRLLTTDDTLTANACSITHVGWFIGESWRAVSDGDTLVLMAQDGSEIVRLVRR